ncbi:sigma-54-dependent transcriptional regulator [Solidesulfovibrio alcoholivorans]|uniref:sigma-54-dependent transcriptional regulator n=1 Tax=Solidesulfovibrio alcoholivorans TaxID=81406 RepID=UPI0004953483|nr:sigma-54 dependent transcriptional regulator [Solidesulfovibrio alcoholivorans]
MKSVCIIDDDPEVRDTIASLTRKMRLTSDSAGTLAAGLELLSRENFDVLFLDVRLPDGNGLASLPEIKRLPDAPEVIILTGIGDPDGAELAIQEGVWDYLVKPSPIKQIMLTLQRALRYREERRCDRAPVSLSLAGCVTVSPRMQPCLDQVAHAACSSAAVLVTGETGTGKELFSRLIHANSARAKAPFVTVDCAALTESLVESTLFGHKKGAFTGATADRVGLVQLANGGTLFLDEVGEMPLSLQKTFLRVLHEKTFRSVGAVTESKSDFRLIAATNRNLEAMVEAGQFRRDLYFRLQTITLRLPPLRERPEDIKPLTLSIVDALCSEYGLPPKGFDAEFLATLEAHDWPGNVRELRNVLERACLASGREKTLYSMHLPQDLRIKVAKSSLGRGLAFQERAFPALAPLVGEAPAPVAGRQTLKDYKETMERRYLEELLAAHGRDVAVMVEISGLSRSHFYALLKKNNLAIPD